MGKKNLLNETVLEALNRLRWNCVSLLKKVTAVQSEQAALQYSFRAHSLPEQPSVSSLLL